MGADNQSKHVELAERIIAGRFKEGRGQGVGRDYLPFLTVRDVPSKGRVHRLPSATVGRVHHLLSDLEHQVFCQLDWHSQVLDIREQFPIAREDTRVLAGRLGIAHPSVQGVDQVVTTDFIVDLNVPPAHLGRCTPPAPNPRHRATPNHRTHPLFAPPACGLHAQEIQ